jgi:hypothetical protein
MNEKNAALLLVLAILMQMAFVASAEQNGETKNVQFTESTGGSTAVQAAVPSAMESSTVIDQRRVGPVCCGIGKYYARIQIGEDPHNIFPVTYYIPENGPGQSKATEAFVILNGESLTAYNIADTETDESFAIYVAEQGKNVFILGRREDSAQPGDDLGFMVNITPETYKFDTYIGILFARFQTSSMYSGSPAPLPVGNVNVTLLGYSMGGVQSTLYLESPYNSKSYRGDVQKHIPVEIAIKFNPKKDRKLIWTQREHYKALKQKWDNGIYYNDEMLGMLYAANLAATDPYNSSVIVPKQNNIEAWRSLMSKTYKYDQFPLTPRFHYVSGNKNRLKGVDETRVLKSNFAAAPYSALSMDIFIAGLLGNVNGYNIDASKINTKTLCIGTGGGFGETACYWFEKEVGKNANVTSIMWGNGGHASWLYNKDAKQLWEQIVSWDNMN